VRADEPEHSFIAHQRLLPITTGHEQNIRRMPPFFMLEDTIAIT
jgi:hypothetical protein